MDMFNSYSGDD